MGLQSTLPHKSSHSAGGVDPITPAAIGAATSAQGAKADSALQPAELTSYRTSAAQDTIDAGKAPLVHGHFQPKPEEYLPDATSDVYVVSDPIGLNGSLSKVATDYWASGDWALTKNGQSYGGVSGSWVAEYQGEGGFGQVVSLNSTTYPWQATWPAGTTVYKTPLARLVGTSLGVAASEGGSTYAARADHVHPLPSALQVGAAPLQSGKIPSQYLPSYVDDVLEYETLAALQADTTARENGKIYVVRNTGKIYRWSGGTLFVEISNTLELQNFQNPDAFASIYANVPGFSQKELPLTGTLNGKPRYTGNFQGDNYDIFWTGTNWKAQAEYNEDGYSYGESVATGNTAYPWQATGWTNGGGVTRVGEYNAALAPAPLGPEAYSGVGTKAAREDHVHPLPTAAAIGAATSEQGAKADQSITNGGGISKVIELTQTAYDALTPAQVDQTATYLVKGSSTQNSTSYEGKEFGSTKPVSFLTQPVIVGSGNRVSGLYGVGGIDWVQAYDNKFIFTTNLGTTAIFNGTLFKTDGVITGGTNSFGGQQVGGIVLNSATKGGGVYDATTAFIPDEKDTPSTSYGKIVNINPETGATSIAWDFNTSTPTVNRADIASNLWKPQDVIVDAANNKLFVSSSYVTASTEGSSVARFSIDPTTKGLTSDGWVKTVTPDGSSVSNIFRMVLLPDGYIFVSNYDFSTLTPAFQLFNAYGASAGNAANVGISLPSGNPVQGAAFKVDSAAPSGIGYLLLAPRTGSEAGNIYAYDYQGGGVFNTSAIDSADLTLIAKNAGLWSNSHKLEIGSLSVTTDGGILCGIRNTATTPIPRCVIAFNWVPYSKSGTLSVQNANNVSITGGSINGVRNLSPKIEYINSSRIWYRDELAKFIRVQGWGGGGGAGAGRKNSIANVVRSGGSGGGGGAYVDVMLDASTIATAQTEVNIMIGAGGIGGAAQTIDASNGNPGTAGGVTSFGVGSLLIRANGGGPGLGGTAAAVTGGTGSVQAASGGSSSSTGGGGSQGLPIGNLSSSITLGQGGAGGGAGGGLTTANATSAGGQGGNPVTAASGGVAGGLAGGGAGNAGLVPLAWTSGGGGSGGGSNTTGDGGSGGDGGPVSGGGGGGASQNGNSGAGGSGGNGFMVLTTYY
jgi:hypothetical protein